MVGVCRRRHDNAPRTPRTRTLRRGMRSKLKRGAYLINTERGKICRPRAMPSEGLRERAAAGYAGDVWYRQPPARSSWRTMPHHGMTPHQPRARASRAGAPLRAGTRDDPSSVVRRFGRSARIHDRGTPQARRPGAHSYSEGDATGGPRKPRDGFAQ